MRLALDFPGDWEDSNTTLSLGPNKVCEGGGGGAARFGCFGAGFPELEAASSPSLGTGLSGLRGIGGSSCLFPSGTAGGGAGGATGLGTGFPEPLAPRLPFLPCLLEPLLGARPPPFGGGLGACGGAVLASGLQSLLASRPFPFGGGVSTS